MADPLTSTLRLTEPTVGGDSGAWGNLLNSNMAYIDAGVNGILGITCSSSILTLEAAGDVGDQARYQWYQFTGTPGANCTVTLPANQKLGVASNNTTGGHNIILTTGSGTTVTIQPSQTYAFFCDGTNVGIMPWSTAGTMPSIGVTGGTSLSTAQSGSFVEVISGNPLTITLPAASGNAGVWFHIFNHAAGTTTLANGAVNFAGPIGSGATTQTLATNTDCVVISDGSVWCVFGQGGAGVFTTGSFTTLTCSALNDSGTSSFTGSATFASGVNVGGNLNVTGTSSFNGSATFGGSVSVVGTLSAGTVSGTSTTTSFNCTGPMQVTGTATFSSAIDVLGTATINTLDVTGTSTQAGAASFGNLVTIAGSAANAALTVNGTGTSTMVGGLGVGAGVSAVTGNFSGTATAAVVVVSGTSTHGGTAYFNSTVAVGTSTMAVLDVTGTSSQVGNVTMGNNLTVAGTGTLAALAITGTSSQAGASQITGTATFSSGVKVVGTATMAVLDVTGTSSQVGAVTMGSTLNVTGTGSYASGVTIGNGLTINASGANITGGAVIANGLSLTGGATFDNANVTSTATAATLSVTGTSTLHGAVAMGGASTVSGALTANSSLTANGLFTPAGMDALAAYSTNTTTIANNGTATLGSWSVSSDRLGLNFNYATGVYTAPSTGWYYITFKSPCAAGTGTQGGNWWTQIYVNGVLWFSDIETQQAAAANTIMGHLIGGLVQLTAGQTVTFVNQNTTGATRTTASGTSGASQYVNIMQVG